MTIKSIILSKSIVFCNAITVYSIVEVCFFPTVVVHSRPAKARRGPQFKHVKDVMYPKSIMRQTCNYVTLLFLLYFRQRKESSVNFLYEKRLHTTVRYLLNAPCRTFHKSVDIIRPYLTFGSFNLQEVKVIHVSRNSEMLINHGR